MSTCLWLERPARWRAWGVSAILAFALLPAVPLLMQALAADGGGMSPFILGNSLKVALLVSVLAWVPGLPAGVMAALYDFPGRRLLLILALLPLLVPSFLWAIGWSNMAVRLGPATMALLGGTVGCVLVFWAAAFPLVLLTTYAAASALSGSQVDAARLAGGEATVLWHVGRYAAIPAALAALLGGVLTLSDPGPGLIFELPTAASEILTSFAVYNDFGRAGRQCALLTAVVLALAAPLAWLAAPRLAHEILARPAGSAQHLRQRGLGIAGAGLVVVVILATIAPLAGLGLPLLRSSDFARAWRDVARTMGNTLLYAGGAAVIATVLGLALAFCAGRSRRLRTACLGIILGLFALPPALGALGVVQAAALAPAWMDPLLRSRLTVCLVLGLRLVPVAALLGLRAWGAMPSSWALAAAVHGIPAGRYVGRVVLPFLLPSAALGALLVVLLALSDIGTAHLLTPPGESTLPLTIFTVMANTGEARVASLCLVYLLLAAGVLTAVWALARRRPA
jgi:iron(III) transport system permease protein